jgi:hypothetical protein
MGDGRLLRLGIAASSLGAAAIHLWVGVPHWREEPLFGAFFLLVGSIQGVWGLLAAGGLLGPPVYLLGAAGNSAVVLIWLVSRTVGLPLGSHPGRPEAVGLLDVAATAFEVAMVLGVVVLLSRGLATSRTLAAHAWH